MTTGVRRVWTWTAVGVAAAMAAAACGPQSRSSGPKPPSAQTAPAARAQNGEDFAIQVFKVVAGAHPADNVVLSPHGVDMVLSMVAAGAKGKTADELAHALHHGATPDDLKALAALEEELRSRNGPGLTLELAASEWLDRAFALYPTYRQAIEQTLGAAPHTVDFAHDPAGATDAINNDVSQTTHTKIPRLLDKLDRATALVLVSAAYLNAKWTSPFEKDDSQPADFTLLDGRVGQRVTMTHMADYATAQGQGWRAARLPYADGRVSMLVVVPDDLPAFERVLNAGTIDGIVKGLQPPRGVELSLPKFEFRTRERLNDTLKDLGVRLAFDPNHADLTGIAPTTQGNLYLSLVQHEAWVRVDEAGTEAAAATAGAIALTSAPASSDVFKVDRPFLFVIRDDATGRVLFIGQVTDPAAGEK